MARQSPGYKKKKELVAKKDGKGLDATVYACHMRRRIRACHVRRRIHAG
jgi:hypothetical protein